MAKNSKQSKPEVKPQTDLAGTSTSPNADELRREFNIALDRMANKLIRTMHVMIDRKLGAPSTGGQS